MALIDDVKLLLRINADAFDGEISDLIEAAKLDLSISGVVTINEADPLIKRAISLYVKANFGLSNPDIERYQTSYDMLKNHLAVSLDYCKEALNVDP